MSSPWRRILLLKTPSSLVGKAMDASCHDRGRGSFPSTENASVSYGRVSNMYMQKHLEPGSRYRDESKSSGLGG